MSSHVQPPDMGAFADWTVHDGSDMFRRPVGGSTWTYLDDILRHLEPGGPRRHMASSWDSMGQRHKCRALASRGKRILCFCDNMSVVLCCAEAWKRKIMRAPLSFQLPPRAAGRCGEMRGGGWRRSQVTGISADLA